jgi:integration host factor subunit alpha
MPKNTVTRVELTEAVQREIGLTYRESTRLVESVLGHMSDALVKGEDVKITKFGTFSVRSKTVRMGRNPRTGEDAVISPRRVIKFIPSGSTRKDVELGNKT